MQSKKGTGGNGNDRFTSAQFYIGSIECIIERNVSYLWPPSQSIYKTDQLCKKCVGLWFGHSFSWDYDRAMGMPILVLAHPSWESVAVKLDAIT